MRKDKSGWFSVFLAFSNLTSKSHERQGNSEWHWSNYPPALFLNPSEWLSEWVHMWLCRPPAIGLVMSLDLPVLSWPETIAASEHHSTMNWYPPQASVVPSTAELKSQQNSWRIWPSCQTKLFSLPLPVDFCSVLFQNRSFPPGVDIALITCQEIWRGGGKQEDCPNIVLCYKDLFQGLFFPLTPHSHLHLHWLFKSAGGSHASFQHCYSKSLQHGLMHNFRSKTCFFLPQAPLQSNSCLIYKASKRL